MICADAIYKPNSIINNLINNGFAKVKNHVIIYAPINLVWRMIRINENMKSVVENNTYETLNSEIAARVVNALNNEIATKLNSNDKVHIIMTQAELSIPFFKFIDSLRGKCKHVTIHAYIHSIRGSEIRFNCTKSTDVESLLREYIDFDKIRPCYGTPCNYDKVTKTHSWINVTKKFGPIKIYDAGYQIDFKSLDFYLTFDTYYGNPIPKIEIAIHDGYNESLAKNYSPGIFGFPSEILKKHESLFKWRMVESFVKRSHWKILESFKGADNIWDYITHQGEWNTKK